MKRLIVNADDFGITHGVNRGILRCYEQGIVTSATIMANGDGFDGAAEMARAHPRLGVGVHIVLVGGRALGAQGKNGSLADDTGELPKTITALISKSRSRALFAHAVEAEIRAQIERALAGGIQPTHLDTHKHTHIYPPVMRALARVAREYNISRVRMPFESVGAVWRGLGGIRLAFSGRSAFFLASQSNRPYFRRHLRENDLRSPQHFFGFFATGRLAHKALLEIVRALPEGTSELVCHPGINDADLERQSTRLRAQRETEMAALTSPDVKQEIVERGVQLISYRELN